MKHYRAIVVIIATFIVSLLILGCAAPKAPATAQAAPPASTPASPPVSAPATPPSPPVTPTPASPPATATTAGQLADAGKAVFADNCAKCHGANGQGGGSPALTGSNASLGKYSTAQGLLDFVSKQMPLGKGGSLSTQAYLQVVVFCLVQNGFVQPLAALDASGLNEIKLTK